MSEKPGNRTFALDRVDLQGTPILILSGDVDRSAAAAVDSWLDKISLQGYRCIGLDLSRVRRLDGPALTQMLKSVERFRACRRRVCVTAASPVVHEALVRRELDFLAQPERSQQAWRTYQS